MFYDRIDTDRIGIFGHSTGGGGAVKLALEDSRIKAVFGLDPWVEPIEENILSQGMSVPSLFIRSEQWEVGLNNDNLIKLVKSSKIKPSSYQIDGANHLDFTMLYMYMPLYKYVGFSGELDPELNASIQRDYILKFFEEELKGESTNLVELDSIYEAVHALEYE
jgi:pimeloyl-ACP methyl ester carboxylesterase